MNVFAQVVPGFFDLRLAIELCPLEGMKGSSAEYPAVLSAIQQVEALCFLILFMQISWILFSKEQKAERVWCQPCNCYLTCTFRLGAQSCGT